MSHKLILIALVGLSANLAFAADKHKHGHDHDHGGGHSHAGHVHVHGAGKLDIAFEKTKGEAKFEINAEALLGRERKAKTDAEKLAEANLLKKLKSDWDKMIVFPVDSGCKTTSVEAKVDYEAEGNKSHADVEVDADYECSKTIATGAVLEVKLIESFPKIQKIEAQVIVDEIQKSATITKSSTSIKL